MVSGASKIVNTDMFLGELGAQKLRLLLHLRVA